MVGKIEHLPHASLSIRLRCLLALVLLASVLTPLRLGLSLAGDKREGPSDVPREVWPKLIRLTNRWDGAQLQILRCSQGALEDETRLAQFRCEPPGLVHVDATGWVEPLAEGTGVLEMRLGDWSERVNVVVSGLSQATGVSFHRQVMAALAVGGCNGGSCHGSPSGKNGFRLSLWGADPRSDYFTLTRELGGRRTNTMAPLDSLILRKALGRTVHEGGVRFAARSLPARVLESWLANGAPVDPSPPALPELQVTPTQGRLSEACRELQLAVHARFPGEDWRDVTRLTVFQSNDATLVRISPTGLVQFRGPGEAAILCRYLGASQVVRLSYRPTRRNFVWNAPAEQNAVDRHVFGRLRELQILPAPLCSDSVFIRRAYLDLLGRLPSVAETRDFLDSRAGDKRARLIDKLLADPQFAEFWTRKWLDVLLASQKRLPKEVLVGLHHWWQEHLRNNTPFDELARQLLTATGQTLQNPPAAFFTIHPTAEDAAETTAQVFLGVRIGCARCHNHPYERWTQDDYYGLAACFARVERRNDPNVKPNRPQSPVQIISSKKDGEILHPLTGQPVPPRPLLSSAPLVNQEDRRVALAHWLTSKENPFFARAVVNRIWFHFFGRGIVEPPDDFRDTNPPSHGALLDFLAQDFIEHRYDLRHAIRTICTSATYQLSSEVCDENADDSRFFSRSWPRLLTAEQLLDAISQVTEVPESFADFPQARRAVALPDSLPQHPFLKAFGQPQRELPCECERHSEPNLAQALQLVSGSAVHRKVTAANNRLARLLASGTSDEAILDELYLAAFSRPPTPRERQIVLASLKPNANRRAAWEDVLWAILNNSEFLHRP